ncbi:MAG: cell envelope integrity protein CreD [Pseudomonadota bacterium]
MAGERSPGIKLLLTGVIGTALIMPLFMVYLLVWDRQAQANVAQNSIEAGWAGAQVISGPLLVIPYEIERETAEVVDGNTVTRRYQAREQLYVSPGKQHIGSTINPEIRTRGVIYQSVVYDAQIAGRSSFSVPEELTRLGLSSATLLLEEAFVQFPMSDPRGLQTDANLVVSGETVPLNPGLGPNAAGSGMHAFIDWSEGQDLELEFTYSLRGSSAFSFVPRGEETIWEANSSWPHPSFTGGFLPGEDDREISADGFTAKWSISNLALGQALVTTAQPQLPSVFMGDVPSRYDGQVAEYADDVATIGLVEPVNLYKLVERALKYGFLFIGFTFLAFLMFDIIAGARVASAEYLLTGAGLILFFVMLLAFAELVGFAASYALSSAAIIGLLSAYSAAVLGSWLRARIIGGLLIALYAVLYVLLNLEAWSLVVGSVLLFAALAGVMYATRNLDWSQVSSKSGNEEPVADTSEAEGIPA